MEIKKLKLFEDRSGKLFPFEFSDLPFVPQRIFFVSEVPRGFRRGGHAHYKGKQILLCLKGQILVEFSHGDGKMDSIVIRQGEYVYLDEMVWDWQTFLTGDDVLLSICSMPYDEKNYIIDFKEYLKLVQK